MKKLFVFAFLFVIAVSSVSCEDNNENTPNNNAEAMPFMGLKSVNDINYFLCDNMGRLIAYGTDGNIAATYEYGSDKIVKKYDDRTQIVYNLNNGLVTSYTFYSPGGNNTYNIKYDSNNRIIQVQYESIGKTNIDEYKWDSSGNLYKKIHYYGYDDDDPAITNYEYLSSKCVFPMIERMEIFNFDELFDAPLALQGYLGNSIPKNNLKSSHFLNSVAQTYNTYSYRFDFQGRPIEIERKGEQTGIINDTWETITYYVWE